MRTESRELLAVGIFGSKSRIGERVEMLLLRGRTFSPRASAGGVAASTVALGALMLAGSLAPRWIAFAQQQPRLAFEVASVKPNASQDFRSSGFQFSPAGRFTVTNTPVVMIVAVAYNVPFQSSRLKGAPGWLRMDKYDIEATAGKDAIGLPPKVREEKMRLMLQALLADRFKLAIHRETKVMPVYGIIRAKNGPKLEKSKIAEKDCPDGPIGPFAPPGSVYCHSFAGGQGRGLHGQAVDISDLALAVTNFTDRPVVDKTGIKGLFHIETTPWLPMNLGPAPAQGARAEDGSEVADLPSIFTVFEQLGLRLEPQKAPVETFVIDHVEKPDAN
jgi:uncharacterized protein (TIGR03435 family)